MNGERFEDAVSAVAGVEQDTRLLLDNPVNPYSYEMLQASVAAAEDAISDWTPETVYGEILQEDMYEAVAASEALAGYITRDEAYDGTLRETLDAVHGDGTYDALQAAVEDRNWAAEYRSRKIMEEWSRKQVDPKNHRGVLADELERLEALVEAYGKSEELIPEDFSYDSVPIPGERSANEQRPRPHWRAERQELHASPENLDAIKEDGDIIIDPTRTIFALFHELCGHGVHQYRSDGDDYPGFPQGFTYRPAASAHKEGFAQLQEQRAETFIDAHRGVIEREDSDVAVRITDENLEAYRIYRENSPMAETVYPRLVIEEERRGEIDSAVDKLAAAYPTAYAEHRVENPQLSLTKAFKEAAYAGGRQLMDRIDAADREPAVLAAGVWSPDTLPAAVDHLDE